ncbi:type III CRISPR-associated RAMP protein Csx7 [Cellulosilyticum ruminicola]|uniref:type III CRISPR-associated RAMP protein Csx7 n=1 Tax=Cellulosilyticum ruminicola TaxID=425254 RepID=UPI0006D06BCE|nr:CRISPR-associated RAMP protein Csx7 [Cellulosilyticum ruminicola]
MLKKLINEAIIECDIKTASPLLIQAGQGQQTLNPVDVDATYIRAFRNNEYQPFIPGSSLKGVFRSYAESILEEACDIVGNNNDKKSRSCLNTKQKDYNGNKIYISLNGEQRYEKSCLVCKLFGSDVLKGRVNFGNAYTDEEYRIDTARMTAIDRVNGGAKNTSLREIEYVSYGVFKEKMIIKNFAPYQIKLLMNCLEALNIGQIRLGSYTTKGFGEVNVENIKLTMRYYNQKAEGYEDKGYYIEKHLEGKENIDSYLIKVTNKDVNINGKAL